MPTKKVLNTKNILWLADTLLASEKQYNQNVYYSTDECGSVCCLSGFCFIKQLGEEKLNKMLGTQIDLNTSQKNLCLKAGKDVLGLYGSKKYPTIFNSIDEWPYDLYCMYFDDNSVLAALYALQRLTLDGCIDRDEKAVHTKIPQIAKFKRRLRDRARRASKKV
jgi:hypothetical protein